MQETTSSPELIAVSNASVVYPIKGPTRFSLSELEPAEGTTGVHALSNASVSLKSGEILGLVGESGSGKSTLARLIAGLEKPSTGEARVEGMLINTLDTQDRIRRSRVVQMVFQDPLASFNPRQKVLTLISEAPLQQGIWLQKNCVERAADLLEEVGLNAGYLNRYPHQLSGGQRQRLAIARALAMTPKAIICDEAVSALDVSVQAQILELFAELRERRNLAIMFISHDLSVIEYLCDRVAVMYLGRIVEAASCSQLFSEPRHPYTKSLLRARPEIGGQTIADLKLQAEPPSPLKPPVGCAFENRCAVAESVCSKIRPKLQTVNGSHSVSCHLNGLALSDESKETLSEIKQKG